MPCLLEGELTLETPNGTVRSLGPRAVVLAGLLAAWGCAGEPRPEVVALDYARALYAGDLAATYRLLSAEDRRVKGERMFAQERDGPTGFALEVAQRLAAFIEGNTAEATVRGERATVRLKLRLPNANAPEIATLLHNWDEERLNTLSATERRQVTEGLADLHRAGRIPMLDAEETVELVREDRAWRIFLNWAGGVRVRFGAATGEAMPVRVTVSPEESRLRRGDRMWVTVRVTNLSARAVTARVRHRIEPEPQAHHLALLQCPLLLPVTLPAGGSEEFRSEYMLLPDLPEQTREFEVTYAFLPVAADVGVQSGAR
ncbi:MAG: cytochrome c oxidase assembly protein [candidate division NC10 bacterium]|nr:cytochrome c oxidase assembly protein [candidate division NC10 bacterium]